MEKYQNELLKDTLELLSFDGEEGKPLPGAPFGEGNRRCLDWFLSKAESFGMRGRKKGKGKNTQLALRQRLRTRRQRQDRDKKRELSDRSHQKNNGSAFVV